MRLPSRLGLDAVTALLAVTGLTLVIIGGSPPSQPQRATDDAIANVGPPAPPSRGPSSVAPSSPGRLGPSPPVRLGIPVIGVDTSLIEVGLNADGTIAVPPVRADAPAGWYRYLPTPGEVGPAVIVGHVDTARDGPAVFYRLRELRPGDAITVSRRDGSVAKFKVTDVTQYPKNAFPSEAVYGPLDYPGLRLITCGGSFDQVHRQYRGNIVVYAMLA